jgi:hypothetical protein
MRQVIIGFTTEGKTDNRFLENIIQRSFEDVAFECEGQIEILPIQHLEKHYGEFLNAVESHAYQAESNGIMVLCVHADADDRMDNNVFEHKINPAFHNVEGKVTEPICRNLVAVVPIQMTEAWMLCDCDLLKNEIGTNKRDDELGIHKPPESYANPKQVIENAISTARLDLTKRRRRELTIGELYLPIGQKVALNKMERLPSYQKFKEAVRNAFRKLNYLH